MQKFEDSNSVEAEITVEVVFAGESKQKTVLLNLPKNTTARQAVEKAELSSVFPDFNFDSAPLGIFGTKVPDNYLLSDQDRVEIYRPLQQSPRQARLERVRSSKSPR